jgi:hypothetical protein
MSSAGRTRPYLPLTPPCAYRTPPSLGGAVIEDYSAIDDRKTASGLRHMNCLGPTCGGCEAIRQAARNWQIKTTLSSGVPSGASYDPF